MSDPFVAEIRIFAGNFAPRGWAFCDGQLLPISQNTALFSLLGTTYGGDGRVTFGLPDLRARSAIHAGQGPGLSPYRLGETGGEAAVTLASAQIPVHTHTLRGAASSSTGAPSAAVAQGAGAKAYRGASNLVAMGAPLSNAGSSQPHENRQPFLAMFHIIALQGIYPSRS